MDETMKKMIVIGLLVCMGLVILGAAGWFFYRESGYKQFTDRKEGFAMKYPRHWKLETNTSPGVIAVFISPKETALDIFQENVTLTMTSLIGNSKTLEEYVKEAQEQLMMVFKDTVVLESVPYQLGSHQGHKFVFSSNKSDPPICFIVYAFLYQDVAYNITYLGEMELYNKRDKPLFEYMMKSLRVLF